MFKKLFSILVITIILSLVGTITAFGSDTTVMIDPANAIKVTGGEITGALSTDKSVAIFKGIPYAAPPVGELRWKVPQPVVLWDGVKQCIKYGQTAMQNGWGSEDCLYLNVWTKAVSTVEKRPVIVYLHGGGFTTGSGSDQMYDGEVLANKDIVYVSINYRVGIFGFLTNPQLSEESTDKVSGNYGILDMIEALKWVQTNITQFGGDPDNVTIMGQSAGANAANLLAVSPKARGLMKNVFLISAIQQLNDFKRKEEVDADLFKSKTLEQMRAMSAKELCKLSFYACPVIDGVTIPADPAEIYIKGTGNNVNMVTGMVTGDADFFNLPFKKKITKKEYESIINQFFGTYAKQILSLYKVKGNDALKQYNEVRSDYMIAYENYIAKIRSTNLNNSTYIYLFNHSLPNQANYGVYHSSDLVYWFSNFFIHKKDYWSKEDYDIGNVMTSYLINFAKTGNPNGTGLPKWSEYQDNNKITYHYIGDTINDKTISSKKVKFWLEPNGM